MTEKSRDSLGLLLGFLANASALGFAFLATRGPGPADLAMKVAFAVIVLTSLASGFLIRANTKAGFLIAAPLSLLVPVATWVRVWQLVPQFLKDDIATADPNRNTLIIGHDDMIRIYRFGIAVFVLGQFLLFGSGWLLAWWRQKRATAPAS